MERPSFLPESVTDESYKGWLSGRAKAHYRRDKKRGNAAAKVKDYEVAIHKAVCDGGGFDAYTGEKLDWSLIGTYNNDDSKTEKRKYKGKFALLPTVDHVGDGTGEADFKICSWRTNSAKSDLSVSELLEWCVTLLKNNGYTLKKAQSMQ